MNFIINYPEGRAHDQFEMFRYPGGEVQVRLTESAAMLVKNPVVETITVVARITDGDPVPVLQLLDALARTTNAPVDLILPYLPYGRADRAFSTGDCFGLHVFGMMMSNAQVRKIYTLDAHSDKVVLAVDFDVSPKPIIEQVISRLDGSAIYGSSIITTAVMLPDKGAARYGYKTKLVASKMRDQQSGKLSGFTVPDKSEFKCDNILIIDDICDGGGTFVGIAEALRKAGVEQDLFLYVTHGIFSKSLSPLKQYFKHVYTTDSFRSADSYGEPGFLTVIPCIETIMEAIERN